MLPSSNPSVVLTTSANAQGRVGRQCAAGRASGRTASRSPPPPPTPTTASQPPPLARAPPTRVLVGGDGRAQHPRGADGHQAPALLLGCQGPCLPLGQGLGLEVGGQGGLVGGVEWGVGGRWLGWVGGGVGWRLVVVRVRGRGAAELACMRGADPPAPAPHTHARTRVHTHPHARAHLINPQVPVLLCEPSYVEEGEGVGGHTQRGRGHHAGWDGVCAGSPPPHVHPPTRRHTPQTCAHHLCRHGPGGCCC